MYWLQLVVIVALLAAVGWLAIGGGGHMSEPMPDRPDLALPNDGMLARTDVDRVRFSVGARGYRMDEVDDVLDRLAHEIELREQRIAELEGRAPRPDAATEGAEDGQGATAELASPEAASESEPAAGSAAEPVGESETVSESENVSGAESTSESTPAPEIAETKNEADDAAAAPVQRSPENEDIVE